MIQARRAFYAGLDGALAMTMLAGMLPGRRLPQHLGLILGSLLVRELSLAAWAFGLMTHLVIGGLLAVAYAALFERVLHRSGWTVGLAVAAVHALLAGPLLVLVPAVNPLVPEALPAPGPYLASMGATAVALFFAAHLLFGVIVGGIYSDLPLPARPPRTTIGL